jgi:hypothetical protein
MTATQSIPPVMTTLVVGSKHSIGSFAITL